MMTFYILYELYESLLLKVFAVSSKNSTQKTYQLFWRCQSLQAQTPFSRS